MKVYTIDLGAIAPEQAKVAGARALADFAAHQEQLRYDERYRELYPVVEFWVRLTFCCLAAAALWWLMEVKGPR